MSIWNNFRLALGKFSQFNGRSRRAEFWGFFLITAIAGIIAGIWDETLFSRAEPFDALVTLIFLIPSLAVGARRLHDTGRSGWWQLIALTGIGYLVILYWCAQDGEFGDNKWGISPKYGSDHQDFDAPFEKDVDDQIL